MPHDELKPKDRVVLRMTRDGAVEENLTEGTSEKVSKRLEDAQLVAPHDTETGDIAEEVKKLDALFARLATSEFRRRFRLKAEDIAYIERKGMETIRRHAADFVRTRPVSYTHLRPSSRRCGG